MGRAGAWGGACPWSHELGNGASLPRGAGLEPRPVGKRIDHEHVGAEGTLSPGNSQKKGPVGASAGCLRANGLGRRRADV